MARLKKLNIPNFHDKSINGLEIVDDSNLILYINSSKIIFMNVKHVRFDDFRMGNIILSMDIYVLEDIKPFKNEILYLLDIDINNLDFINAVKERIRKEELLFVSIQSSYGLKGYLLCKDIKIYD